MFHEASSCFLVLEARPRTGTYRPKGAVGGRYSESRAPRRFFVIDALATLRRLPLFFLLFFAVFFRTPGAIIASIPGRKKLITLAHRGQEFRASRVDFHSYRWDLHACRASVSGEHARGRRPGNETSLLIECSGEKLGGFELAEVLCGHVSWISDTRGGTFCGFSVEDRILLRKYVLIEKERDSRPLSTPFIS